MFFARNSPSRFADNNKVSKKCDSPDLYNTDRNQAKSILNPAGEKQIMVQNYYGINGAEQHPYTT